MATQRNKESSRQFISPEKWARLRQDPPPLTTLQETKVSYGTLALRMADRPYHIGETVTGEVVLDYRSEITIRSIGVKIHAEEIYVTGGENSTTYRRDMLVDSPQYVAKKKGIVCLVYQQEADGKLPLGMHTWPFSFEIPPNALPSFSFLFAHNLHLVYDVQAYVDIPKWPDTHADTKIEVRPSVEQHRQMLAHLPHELVEIPGFKPKASLIGPTPIEVTRSPWNLCSCRCPTVTARLTAAAPVVIPFRSGIHTINAQLEIYPPTAPVRQIVVELTKLCLRDRWARIQRQAIPFHRSSIVDISLDVTIEEEQLTSMNNAVYQRDGWRVGGTWGAAVNTFSFETNWASVHYLLLVQVEMRGLSIGSPILLAEIPVVQPEALEPLTDVPSAPFMAEADAVPVHAQPVPLMPEEMAVKPVLL